MPSELHHLNVVVRKQSGNICDITLAEEVSVENPRIYFYNLRGIYEIECTSDDGTIYIGVCEF